MSSGRTAGVMCRTTIRSIAHPACSPAAARWSTASDTTPALASSRRTPLLVRRSTSAFGRRGSARTAASASCGCTPGSSTCQTEASSRAAGATARSAASITSIPSGRAASSATLTSSGSRWAASPISRYSASLAAPVGAPPGYEIFGCGEKPAEYATGRPARRTPRSTARAMSLWLAKRILPRLAYLMTSR